MTNDFGKHYNENFELYDELIDAGKISLEDLDKAANASGDVPYAEQDEANKKIHAYLQEFAKKNPDDEEVQKFVSSFPKVQKFEPKAEDWQKYNQEQMGRLAESMKFNWRNKEDRSQMMNQLMNEQIAKDKKQIYQDYKKENPVAAFINENIIAPNVSKRMERGEDITNKDVALDAANVGTYLFPGAGAAASKAGKAALFAADAALQGGVGAASDINQGNELGIHNVAAPLIGAGAGAVTDLVPRMAKVAVDVATGGFGGRVSQPVGDVAEGWITKIFGDEIDVAKNALSKQAKEAKAATTVRKNASEATKKALQAEGKSATPNAASKQFAKDKNFYANNPEKWAADVKSGKIKDPEQFLSDPNFAKVVSYKAPTGSARVGREAARGTSRQTGKGVMISQANSERSKNAKPSLEQVFASPELADWIRLKKRGYNPAIPSQYREYEEQLNAMIHDPNRNLR